MLTVYIGYDSSNDGQKIAHNVCVRSIKKYNNRVKIVPLIKSELEKSGLYYRENDPKASTEFTYTRFLVPYLNNYEGIAVFCDSDFLYRYDIEELLKYYDETKAVMCVKHEQKSLTTTKFSGRQQNDYPRKNWSSLMLFNCAHSSCKNLTINAVNKETPKYLHRMEWCKDNEIGEIPYQYNYLLGYYFTNDAKAVHFTEGGPWHNEWYNYRLPKECIDKNYSNEWFKYVELIEYKNLIHELNDNI
jgi:lipopolysaccharide biosynthesis glycosyltransferase